MDAECIIQAEISASLPKVIGKCTLSLNDLESRGHFLNEAEVPKSLKRSEDFPPHQTILVLIVSVIECKMFPSNKKKLFASWGRKGMAVTCNLHECKGDYSDICMCVGGGIT